MSRAKREASDWLSPVLVKEMRQGLKSKGFGAAFLLMQAAMLASMAFALATESTIRMRQGSTVAFWTVTVVSLLLFIPARGLNAMASEVKERTLELMILTRLSAWRIVAGKWASLVAQCVLLVTGLLPYLVLRYYLGAVNLFTELAVMLLLLLASIFLIALTVFASTYKSVLARLMLVSVQGMALMMGTSFAGAASRGMGGSAASSARSVPTLALFVGILAVAALVVLVLQAAASRVAPPAENHAAPKRAITLGLIALTLLPVGPEFRLVMLAVLVPALALVCLETCSEPISRAPTAYLPYAGMRGPLSALGLLLYPGWPSGLLFTAVVAASVSALLAGFVDLKIAESLLVFLGFMAAVAMPVALSRLPKRRLPVALWALGFHFVVTVGALALGEAAEFLMSVDEELIMSIAPILTVGMAGASELPSKYWATSAVGMALWIGLAGLLLLWRGRSDVRELRRVESQARTRAAGAA